MQYLTSVRLIIAHNAAFDRPFVDKRLAQARGIPWACSMKEIPWRTLGFASVSLEFLMMKHCRMFFDAHRAADDANATIQILAKPLDSDGRPLSILLESARSKTARIWAVAAPFEMKDALKMRGYVWNDGTDSRPKAWSIEVREDARGAEEQWLTEHIYAGRIVQLPVDLLDAKTRYSSRM